VRAQIRDTLDICVRSGQFAVWFSEIGESAVRSILTEVGERAALEAARQQLFRSHNELPNPNVRTHGLPRRAPAVSTGRRTDINPWIRSGANRWGGDVSRVGGDVVYAPRVAALAATPRGCGMAELKRDAYQCQ
jgi:hypothetical protein